MKIHHALSFLSGKSQNAYSFLQILLSLGAFLFLFSVFSVVVVGYSERTNSAALQETTIRDAQCVVSVLNSAQAAGADLNAAGVVDSESAVKAAIKGVVPVNGAFANRIFTIGPLRTYVTVDAVAALIRVEIHKDGQPEITFVPSYHPNQGF